MMKMLLMTTALAALIVVAAAEANPNRGNYLRHNNDDRILKKIKWEQFAEELQESLASAVTTQPSANPTYEPSASPTKVRFPFIGWFLYHAFCIHDMCHLTLYCKSCPRRSHYMIRHQQLHHRKSLHWLPLNCLLMILRR